MGQNNHYKIIASVLFGASLIAMYLSSALYHIVQQPYYKYILKILDHATIYLLIAGSYTPFALVSLRGPIGWALFIVIWSLALLGVVFKLFFTTKRFGFISTLFYIIMGWLAIVAIKPIYYAVSLGGVTWIVAGGYLTPLVSFFIFGIGCTMATRYGICSCSAAACATSWPFCCM